MSNISPSLAQLGLRIVMATQKMDRVPSFFSAEAESEVEAEADSEAEYAGVKAEAEGEAEGEAEAEAEGDAAYAESEDGPGGIVTLSEAAGAEAEAEGEAESEAEAEAEAGTAAVEPEVHGAPTYAPRGVDFHAMDCIDMVIGTARGSRSRVFDYYTRDRSTPRKVRVKKILRSMRQRKVKLQSKLCPLLAGLVLGRPGRLDSGHRLGERRRDDDPLPQEALGERALRPRHRGRQYARHLGPGAGAWQLRTQP